MKKTIGFIGLGVMGSPIAGHLARAGHHVTVYNRTAEKAENWLQHYTGQRGFTPASVAENADFVFTCVGNDDDLREVVLGERGVLRGMRPHSVLIDHSTTSARVARELGILAAKQQVSFIDAPVSGGQSGAEKGILSVMAGADDVAVFAAAQQVMGAYARTVQRMGNVGCGQLTKMVNQICIAGLLQGLAEGLHFAQQAELDTALVLAVISKGAAQSWQMDNRGATMVAGEFDFGFAVDWMRKDLGIVLAEARDNGAALPVTALVDQFYAEVQEMGGQRWDTSSLITRLQRFTGRGNG